MCASPPGGDARTENSYSTFVVSGAFWPYRSGNDRLQDDSTICSGWTSASEDIPDYQVIQQSLALVEKLRELRADDQAVNLLTADGEPTGRPTNLSATRLPYFKTKIEVRPVFDQTVYTRASLKSGPTKRFQAFPKLGVYQPYLYLSDFWLLEKDYLLLDSTLKGTAFNLTLTYSAASMLAYASQTQMTEQWAVKSEWGLTDTQRDSFMVKRLIIETNPYFLAFSACFILLHIVFQTLAFKNDIQFWRKNESMEGLSARTEIVSFVCRLVMTLYLLDSKEASRLVIFPVILDLVLGVWRLRKAVKLELKLSFPFISFGNQPGYENSGTSKYDDEATYYMLAMMAPAFLGYVVRSAIHGRHRSWYSFLVGSAAGGVYTFGFIMMTPQLYINYRLKSVERLPWRAMTYKAMNTFVDDISAFLIDMPMMHRVSCFRDDVIFFIYLYQRWTYRVDKTRPSQWVREEEPAADAVAPLGVDPPAAPRAPDQDPGVRCP
ncbi:unnamed protein product [Prorocentrum cordatum]|uniref:Cleft lip and palate transmembrane protein 1 n=1 Tax=Prorocentrum cordatum TaxID=2364126 RepID=A0ABN9XP38_9DINO|nr:unnamed protein product [Polarella glacialis]